MDMMIRLLGVLLLLFTVLAGTSLSQAPNPAAIFPAIMERERDSLREPCDDSSQKNTYDFIVVGVGTAGSVLVNRLTEVKEWTVLGLEAGGEATEINDIPYLIGLFQQTDLNWHYKTIPSQIDNYALKDRLWDYPAGKGVGGCTLINYMFYVRGNKMDYDNWEELGNPGWGYDDVLPYFRKSEDVLIPELRESQYHSRGGNLEVSYPPYRSNFSDVLLQAGNETGNPQVDYNGKHQTGFARFQTTTIHGSRWTATKGYLYSIRNRPNFHLKKRATVKKILINESTNTAYGVVYNKNGRDYNVYARKEVILCAGALNSPQLLMLSGLGPKEHLEELGIRVIKDLKVGYNLMDHIGHISLLFTLNQSVAQTPVEVLSNPENLYQYYVNSNGPLTSNLGFEVVSFHDLDDRSPGWPEFETLYISSALVNNPMYAAGFGLDMDINGDYIAAIQDVPAFQAFPFVMRPKSRGRITLRDKDINSPPLIDVNAYSHEEDIELQMAAIRKVIELANTSSLQRYGAKVYDKPVPVCAHLEFGTDDYWRSAILNMSIPIYHQCGTCKMGPADDDSAVVDSMLKVHGVRRLRVVDTSIFPQIISGHMQSPVYMVAEKAADFIKEDYRVKENSKEN